MELQESNYFNGFMKPDEARVSGALSFVTQSVSRELAPRSLPVSAECFPLFQAELLMVSDADLMPRNPRCTDVRHGKIQGIRI